MAKTDLLNLWPFRKVCLEMTLLGKVIQVLNEGKF